MSKNIQVTLSVKKRRELNEVDFAAAIDALANTKLEIKDPFNYLHNYTFDSRGWPIYLNGRHISAFLGDLRTIVGEHAQYEREQTELRRANEDFSGEHVRLSERVADQERRLSNQSISIGNYQKAVGDLEARLSNANNACVTWEQRHTHVTEKLAQRNLQVDNLTATLVAKVQLLNAAGRDLEAMRERATGFQEELSAALKECDAVKQALVCEQTKSGNLKESCDRLVMARENQRNTIIGMQQRAAAFDAECTRLRIEVANERNERRQEAAAAAGLSELYRLRGEALTSISANYRMADQALSSRNEELAVATAALEAARKELASSGRTLAEHTHNHGEDAAQYAVNAYDAAGKAARVVLTFCADGTVTLDTGDNPIVLNSNIQTTGALSS